MSQPTSTADSEISLENPLENSLENSPDDAGEISALRARTYAVCALCIATASVFFLTGVSPLPVLLYFPLKRRFGFEPQLTELSMDFYGRSLLALLAGLAAALSTYALLRMLPDRQGQGQGPVQAPAKDAAPKKSVLLLLTGYAATALMLAVTLYAYLLATRLPTLLPLPKALATQPEFGAE
jgi:hypothetical protein